MQLNELDQLTKWIDAEIRNKKIIGNYEALYKKIKKNTQPNQPQDPFENEKNQLITTIKDIPLDQLTNDQLVFLNKLGMAEHIGPEGVENLENILYKNVIDIGTTATELEKIINNLNNGINKSDQIKMGISGCVEIEEGVPEEILIRVSFLKNATIANLTDLKTWGKIWHDIGRGIAMFHGSAPEDIRIVGAKSGSIILELTAVYGIAKIVSSIILMALNLVERVIIIETKAEELSHMKLSNANIAADLKKEAEDVKKNGVEEIITTMIEPKKEAKRIDGEQTNALTLSIKNLVDFIQRGGEIDCIVPDENLEEKEGKESNEYRQRQELRDAFQTIRQLENKIRLLGPKKDQNED